ncbi:MAG: UvrD-helicase domain-containing protein [Deltaproteobacteria bacterium]|jgi:ATP-dependent exoDNAse (exonuclease V) beta subunit|nr:UvrD-helicase domain-containing protein [Deltaproteobacteria bacterium]
MSAEFNTSQTAVLDSRRNFCVIAGAGSGKTGTMVEYIIRFIEDDLENNSITQVLALTFSEKAAAEMSERVARAIRDRLKAAKQAGHDKLAAQWEREFRRLGQAEIGTIHGYSFGLIKSYSHLLGLPMDLEVDAADSPELDLDEVIKDLLNNNDPDLSYLLRLMPLKAENGPSISRWLLSCVTRQTSWGLQGLASGVQPPSFKVGSVLEELALAVAEAKKYVEGQEFDEEKYPRPAEGVRRLAGLMGRLRDEGSGPPDQDLPILSEELLVAFLPRLLSELVPLNGMLSSWRKKGTHNHKHDIGKQVDRLRSFQASVEAVPFTGALVRLANQAPDLMRARRLARRQISFDDILSQARALLRGNPRVRAEESARWRLIIVDEFQDTNRLQADLLAQLIPSAGQGFNFRDLDWPGLPSKLRVVGDPKQSIYRFRGSEPSIMADLASVLAKGGGEVLPLDTNYRSQARLIDFFNDFFLDVLPENYDRQLSARPDLYQGKPVVCLTGEDPRPSARMLAPQIQAQLVVSYLRDLFGGQAGVLVADKARGGGPEPPPRLPVPGDVAILMRRRKNSGLFQAALTEAGWPCHTLKGQDLFDIPEITGLAAAYLYLCGRSPDLNLAAAIRSPLGPVSEETLTRLAWPEAPKPIRRALSWYFQDEGRPWPTGVNPFELGTLIRLRRLFINLRPYALRRPPGEIIEALVEERNLLPLLVAGEGGSPDRVRNIQYFIDYIKTVPMSDHFRPEGAADVIEGLLSSGLNKGDSGDESMAGLPDEGSINIMTVHRAKGLEFPIVVIPEAETGLPRDNAGLKISDAGQVVVKFRSEALGTRLEPPEFEQFKRDDDDFARAENKRLLYVAATRARDHLAFVGRMAKPGTDSWLGILGTCKDLERHVGVISPELEPPEASQETPAATDQATAAPTPAPDEAGFIPSMILPAPVDDFIQLRVTEYSRIFAAFKLGAASLEEATRQARSNQQLEDSPIHATVGPREGPTSPVDLGILFHSILETSGFDLDEAAYRSLAREKAVWLGLALSDDEANFLASKALRFQSCEYGQELRRTMDEGRLFRREWPFWLRLEKDEHNFGPIQLSGVVDLFYVNENGHGRVIDYKLAKAGHSLVYEKQLEIYALAIRKAGFAGELEARIWYSGA